MKMTWKKSVALVVALMVLLVGMLAGCGGTNTPAETTKAAGETTAAATQATTAAPTLPKVELQFYMVGDAPKDLQMVQDKVNEMALKDLNCTVKYNYTTWTDYQQKYALILTSGQPCDLIYTASWREYPRFARTNAFTALDDYLAKDCPDLQKFVPENLWNQVKIGGKIYTIPCTFKEYIPNGFIYRKDLQEKFSLPEPTSLETAEQYMLGIKKNMPEQLISLESVSPGAVGQSFSAYEALQFKYPWISRDTPYGLTANYDTPSNLFAYWGSPDFVADMKIFKRWADEGFWSKSALSNKVDATAFDTGKTVVSISGENPMKFAQHGTIVASSHPDWKVGYSPYPLSNKVAYIAHGTQNGYAVPSSSKNVDRALMFFQKMVLDKNYNLITSYGIEGTHYKVENGYYVGIGDATKSGFPREGMNCWGWRNPDYMLFDKSYDAVKELNKKFDEIAAASKWKGMNIFNGFAEDFTSYQSERAAIGTVLTQYLAPLEAGLVPNVDAAVKTFMEKAKAAGLEKIQAEYTKQWKAYCTEYGYDK